MITIAISFFMLAWGIKEKNLFWILIWLTMSVVAVLKQIW